MNLSKNTKVTMIQAPLVAGATDPLSSSIDMSGYEGCLFIGNWGTATGGATGSLQVQTAASTTATFVDLTGAVVASTGGGSDGYGLVDVYQPQKRYLKTQITRATSNLEWGGTLAIQYGAKKVPSVHSSTTNVATEVLTVSPAT